MSLDNYIYDSQFEFLGKTRELITDFKSKVLSKAKVILDKNNTAYFKKEDWDSEKFGKNFGRLIWLENNAPDEFYKKVTSDLNQFDCSYIRLNKEHAFCNWAKENKLSLLSGKISQHIDLSQNDFQYDTALSYTKWKKSQKDDSILNQVLDLAKTSFLHNRFSSDNHFTTENIEMIYGNWIVNEINSAGSNLYFLLENNSVASFFLYRENISPLKEYKIGFVSLIASSPKFKEKKYASNLLNYVLNEAKNKHTQCVIANTESKNTDALGFFKKNNFIETAHLNEYHLWN